MSENAANLDLEVLKAQVEPVQNDDLMAEAGRKILLVDFIKMLSHEAGSRTGEDIEDVHDMRVATRRMRSALNLLEPYFKGKVVRGYRKGLKSIASALGDVRDLDVLIDDIEKASAELNEEQTSLLESVLKKLNKRRKRARKKLNAYLDSKSYRKFLKEYAEFLTTEGKSATSVDEHSPEPIQVRHVVPVILAEHLAAVRAYDPLMHVEKDEEASDDASSDASETVDDASNDEISDDESTETSEDADTIDSNLPDLALLHSLRIEFKRLRYATDYFSEVLGSTGEQFVDEIKILQDILGRLQDIRVAQEHFEDLIDEGVDMVALAPYLQKLSDEQTRLEADLLPAWERFNTRTVQSKLSNALLTLR